MRGSRRASRSRSLLLALSAGTLALWPAVAAAQDAPPSVPLEAPAEEQPLLPPGDEQPGEGNLPESSSLLSPRLSAPDQTGFIDATRTPSGQVRLPSAGAIGRRGLSLFVDQSIRYDDNARRLVQGQITPFGRSKGDFYSVTTIGAGYRTMIGLQQFYVNGSYGVTRYRRNDDLNKDRYSLVAGVDWRVGTACSGNFNVSTDQSESPFEDTINESGDNVIKTDAVNFSGRCHLFERIYGTFGASARQVDYSINPVNNFKQNTVRVGLEYSIPKLHNIGIQASFSDYTFTNDTARNALNLITGARQNDYIVYYKRIISPKTDVYVSAGVTDFSSSGAPVPAGSSSSASFVTYSANANWRPTAKIALRVSSEFRVAPPQGLTADYQKQYTHGLSVIYKFSPKLSFVSTLSRTQTDSTTISSLTGTQVGRSTRTTAASLDANYRLSPFLTTTLGYRFTDRIDAATNLRSKSNLYTVGLSYRPDLKLGF